MTSSGWMPGITILPSPNYWAGHNGQKVKAAVIHVTGGAKDKEYPNAVSWLCNPDSGVSAHFVISQAGDIAQLVSIYDSAWANGASYKNGHWYDPEGNVITPAWTGMTIPTNPNWYTISLETARQSSDPMSQQMVDAVVRILQWMKAEFGWTYVAHGNLVGHNEISPVSRPYCPGPNVSLTKLADAANGVPTPLRKFRVTASDGANVRQGPGTNYPIAGVLPFGAIFLVDKIIAGQSIGGNTNWLHLAKTAVQADLGFVSATIVSEVTT